MNTVDTAGQKLEARFKFLQIHEQNDRFNSRRPKAFDTGA